MVSTVLRVVFSLHLTFTVLVLMRFNLSCSLAYQVSLRSHCLGRGKMDLWAQDQPAWSTYWVLCKLAKASQTRPVSIYTYVCMYVYNQCQDGQNYIDPVSKKRDPTIQQTPLRQVAPVNSNHSEQLREKVPCLSEPCFLSQATRTLF